MCNTDSMDLVVVPQITLNPKKARRNLKKAAQKGAPATAAKLPADSRPDLSIAPCDLENSALVLSDAPKPNNTRRESAEAALRQPQLTPIRRLSWFEITEEDDDDFRGPAPTAIPIMHAMHPPAAPSTAALIISGLPVEAWSHVLLFNEVSAVGRAAAVCTALRDDMWEASDFWSAYAGPNFAAPAGTGSSPPAVRRAFQRWIHTLEGPWGVDFANTAPICHHADTFGDAARLLAGLQPGDETADGAQAAVFARALLVELERFDATCGKTRDRACEAVMRACAVRSVLPAGAADEMRAAFDASVERAHATLFGERPRPEPRRKKPAEAVAIGRAAALPLHLRALSVLRSSRPARA